MQFDGGAMIRVDWIARYSSSAAAPWTFRGRASGESLAVRQISWATAGETRLKSAVRNPASEWLRVSCSIRSSTPNSIP
jgi:hypothetical protein